MTHEFKTIMNSSFYVHFKNSFWMLLENFMKLISAIFVTIYLARYLGPESFGVLSFSLAVSTLLFGIARMGMDSVLVRELVSSPEKSSDLMGTAFGLMLGFSLVLYLFSSVILIVFEKESSVVIYTLVISIGVFFQSLFVVSYLFQANLESKYTAIARVLSLVISAVIKILLVLNEAELFWFAVAYAIDFIGMGAFLLLMHFYKKQPNFIGKFDKGLVRQLLKSSIPMTLSAVSFMLYGKIDQFMINALLGSKQLGLYSAAIKLYEGWLMFPYILVISLLPLLVKQKHKSSYAFEKSFIRLVALILWGAISVFIITYFFNEELILLTFGSDYTESSSVVVILFLAAVFTLMGTLTARYLNVEKLEKKLIKITIIALCINVFFNWYLIPRFGIDGAAYATLISMFCAFYVYDMFDKDLRLLFKMKNKGLLFMFNFRFLK